jgi:hypothetical protein
MQLEVSVDELRKKKLFVATPMYGGMAHGMYMKSCLDLQAICSQYGIEVRFSFIFNESLITRARNYLADEYLRAEGFTHMLFIDADIHFDPRDVIACLALDKEIIGGPYPKKSIKWGSVKEAVKRHPDIEPLEMEKVAGDFVFNPVPGTEKFSVAEPIEVLEIGTGFMMIKREVFEKFREAYPEFSYRPDHIGQANFDGTRYIHAFFDTVIDRKRTVNVSGEEREVGGSDRYLSEDYMFCQWWRNIGGKIWLCPWMKTHHIGTYAFTGDMPAVANYVGSL